MSDTATVAPFGSELTPMERRALDAIRTEYSEAAAARLVGCSRHTIHGHLANARSRLGVHTTREAIDKIARPASRQGPAPGDLTS